jgi:FlaG/FlaF family flagellin (archaellin)
MAIKNSKKAMSPVIITILLVLLVIFLATIIYLWATSFIKEGLTKFGEPIERACDSVLFEYSLSGNELLITNTGSVSIYKIKIMTSSMGSSSSISLNQSINKAQSRSFILPSGAYSGAKIIPILLGSAKNEEVNEFQCPKNKWRIIN